MILQIKNFRKIENYELKKREIDSQLEDTIIGGEIFNGMIGQIEKITEIDGTEYFKVNFDYKSTIIKENEDEDVVYFECNFLNKKFINDSSYINTVHKYQGSENENVIFIISSNNDYLKRNIIYTAISRAKNRCIVICDRDILAKGLKNREYRDSQLNLMIREKYGKEKFKDKINEDINEEKININNKKDKKGIPTTGFNSIQCRSRIEAKMSYFFDYIGWTVIYEEYDLEGYTPDFIIKKTKCRNIKNLMVEIKGEPTDDAFDEYYYKAIDSGLDGALLIINNGPKFDKCDETNYVSLGTIYFKNKKIRKCEFILYCNEDNKWVHAFIYKKKMYNKIFTDVNIEEPIHFDNNTNGDEIKRLEIEWNKISKNTQYKGVNNNCA